MRKFIALVFIFVVLLLNAAPVLACEPPPPTTETNCDDLGRGYQFGFRLQGAPNGTYALTSSSGRLTGGAPSDRNNTVKISHSDARSFDWDASLGIDAVIIQAGGQTKVKKLNEETSGNRFHGATDWRGKPYRVEKVEFCYDYALDVSTSAEGIPTGGPATWEITKTVAAAEKSAFASEKAVFDYTVAVHKVAGGDSGYNVKSNVTIKNNTPLTATITSVKGSLNPGSVTLLLDCGDVHFPYRLSAGNELTCSAATSLTSQVDGTVTAEVKTYGKVSGDSARANIAWSGAPAAAPADDGSLVTVTDTNVAFGGPYTVSGDQTWTYAVELACPGDPAAYTNGQQSTKLDNTAAITETGQSASQSVTLLCYAPTVSTTAGATYDELYTWGITKTSPLTVLELQENESASVDYVTTVSVTSLTQTNVKLAGSVTIGNPRPDAPLTVDLIDEMAPGVPAPLAGCASPLTVAAGESVTCNFETAPETLPSGANNVQVVFNGITFAATAPFEAAVNDKIDECVTVTDTAFEEPLGVVCADQAPATFPYSVTVGPYPKCRETTYLNTATFVTNDTGVSDFSTWELPIDIKCPIVTNCVRTILYWQNHSNQADPTTYNATWNLVSPSGPATPFYTTGSTWIQILGSNAGTSTYLKLAQAYAAAKLNTLWGALPTEAVGMNLTQAEALLAQYATTQSQVTGAVTTEFRNATTGLSNFNRGVTGSPVCTDCNE